MSKYGEPWASGDIGNSTNDTLYMVHSFVRDGKGNILMGSWLDKDSPMLLRACACVNALAGVEDPEAVRELVMAAQQMFLSECDAVCEDMVDNCEFGRDLRKALAPFEGME